MKHRPKGGKELFTFNFSLDNHLELLKISTSEGERHGRFVVLGTQGDNLAQEFVFERNLEYANDDLVLAFKNSRESFGEINLGSGNTYQIPNALTQLRELSMQVIIKSGDQIKASSNTIDFELRKAITPGSSPVETIPNPVKELEEQAIVSQTLDGGDLVSQNIRGEECSRVSLPVGGGTSGESDPLYSAEKPNIVFKADLIPLSTKNEAQDQALQALTTRVETSENRLDDILEEGVQGPQGPPGSAATVGIGTTTTLSPGSSATVTNSGTSQNAILNIGIPKGADGSAATVSIGTTTTLPSGSPATVTNSGTSQNAVLNIGIPKGADGIGGSASNFPFIQVAESTLLQDTGSIEFVVGGYGKLCNFYITLNGLNSEVNTENLILSLLGNTPSTNFYGELWDSWGSVVGGFDGYIEAPIILGGQFFDALITGYVSKGSIRGNINTFMNVGKGQTVATYGYVLSDDALVNGIQSISLVSGFAEGLTYSMGGVFDVR